MAARRPVQTREQLRAEAPPAQPLAAAPQPAAPRMGRRRAARAVPAAEPAGRAGSEAGREMELPVGTLLLSLPIAFPVGDMLTSMSLEPLPRALAWTAFALIVNTAATPAFRQGTVDFFVDALSLAPETRERLGVPDQLWRAPSRSFWGDIIAPVRTWRAAVVARETGEQPAAEAASSGQPPAGRAGAGASPARSDPAEAVDVSAVDALDEGASEGAEPDIGLPVVRLEDVANLDNLWVVGPKGSGKTTTVQRLIALRRGQHWALDPHGTPGKWPGCVMVGSGRDFPAIDRQLNTFIGWMDRRYKAMGAGEVTEAQCRAARRTMVGDEWRAIRTALPGIKGRGGELAPSASGRLLDVLTEGRKAGICVLTASHLDTAEGMGVTGEKDILKCFDLIIYLGAMAVKHVPAAAAMGRPAVIFDPERGAYAQLHIPPLVSVGGDVLTPSPPPEAAAPERQRQVRAAEGPRPAVVSMAVPPPDPLLAALLAGGRSPAPASADAIPLELDAVLSPERRAKLAALQAQRAVAAPKAAAVNAAQPAGEPPLAPPSEQRVTVDHPSGGQVIVNVSQVAPTPARRSPAARKGMSAGARRRRADEYRAVREVIARGGSANDARRETQIGRDRALAYARQARAELGLAAGPEPAS